MPPLVLELSLFIQKGRASDTASRQRRKQEQQHTYQSGMLSRIRARQTIRLRRRRMKQQTASIGSITIDATTLEAARRPACTHRFPKIGHDRCRKRNVRT